jgi:hypothetical protein
MSPASASNQLPNHVNGLGKTDYFTFIYSGFSGNRNADRGNSRGYLQGQERGILQDTIIRLKGSKKEGKGKRDIHGQHGQGENGDFPLTTKCVRQFSAPSPAAYPRR